MPSSSEVIPSASSANCTTQRQALRGDITAQKRLLEMTSHPVHHRCSSQYSTGAVTSVPSAPCDVTVPGDVTRSVPAWDDTGDKCWGVRWLVKKCLLICLLFHPVHFDQFLLITCNIILFYPHTVFSLHTFHNNILLHDKA